MIAAVLWALAAAGVLIILGATALGLWMLWTTTVDDQEDDSGGWDW